MQVLSVSQLNRYVKSVLDSNPLLGEVFVRGEISALSAHAASGHMYFSLKEGNSTVRAVMFRQNAGYLRFKPSNGLSVLIRGQASLYERDGSFQIYVSDMQLDGVGSMYIAFERLKTALEAEGLFDLQRKRRLPPMPRGIGIITSSSGAAYHDVVKVLSRRYPIGRLILYPAYVQGANAVPSLIKGLVALEAADECDVIIIGRGGGSPEDLWTFNEEPLVRAVAACQKPVVCAVGHETDFTLCDFAADVRAPTPSAAAEIVAPDLSGLAAELKAMAGRMAILVSERIRRERRELSHITQTGPLRDAGGFLRPARLRLDTVKGNLERGYALSLANKRRELAAQAAALDAKSPLKTIARGYTLTTDESGHIFTSDYKPSEGQSIHTRFCWGEASSIVKDIEVYENEKTKL